MKIWYFHGQYITNGFGTNEMLYNIFDLPQMSNLAAEFQKKKKKPLYIHSSIQTKKVEKYLKTRLHSRI